jgi:hypothetical protein
MRSRISLATVASIGILAFGLEPIVHEVLGHAVVCWFIGGKIVLISSTAMQTASTSRLVPVAGPLANIIFGLAALALLRAFTSQQTAIADARTSTSRIITSATPAASGVTRVSLAHLFLYFFAFANLFLAFGYILYSGLINFGDFAAVVSGLRPAWLYRATLVVIGALGYRYGIAQAARCLAALPPRAYTSPASDTPAPPLPASSLSLPAARHITRTACFAGGGLFFLSSFLNPISPNLILYDGLSGAIGLTLGFFLALTDLRQSGANSAAKSPAAAAPLSASDQPTPEIEIPFNLPLTIAATIFAAAFLIFMGHGIRLP